MKIEKCNGVGGEWTKVHIEIEGKLYRRITDPQGRNQYASITNRANNIRSSSRIAKMIDKAIGQLA